MILQIKNILYKAKERWQKNRYQKYLQTILPEIPDEGIHINYGNVVERNSGQIIHGGRVKLLHLQQEFPENIKKFNILYLVSSAQPPFAEEIIGWAKRHGVKVIWNQDGVAYPAWAGETTSSVNRIMKILIHDADYVIYQSNFCHLSADRYLGKISVPSQIIYNCVDIDLFSPITPNLPIIPWTLLTTGSHQQAERVLSVLQTIAILKKRKRDVRLILAGRLDWPQAMEEVQDTVRKFGIKEQVLFSPPYTQEEAPALYRKAHVLLHTKYKDPCPTVVIEAMACGLPVVGSNSGGMPELIGNDGGILIDVPDSWDQMYYPTPEKIANSIEVIFTNLSEWQFRSREWVLKNFDKNGWIDLHKQIFQEVLTN